MSKRIFLPKETVEALEKLAEEQNVNVEEAMLKICKKFMEEHEG